MDRRHRLGRPRAARACSALSVARRRWCAGWSSRSCRCSAGSSPTSRRCGSAPELAPHLPIGTRGLALESGAPHSHAAFIARADRLEPVVARWCAALIHATPLRPVDRAARRGVRGAARLDSCCSPWRRVVASDAGRAVDVRGRNRIGAVWLDAAPAASSSRSLPRTCARSSCAARRRAADLNRGADHVRHRRRDLAGRRSTS